MAVAAGALAAGAGAIWIDNARDRDDDTPAAVAALASPETRTLAEFNQLASVGPQDITVTIGEGYSVRSEGSARALGQLEAVVEDGTLAIRPRKGFANNWGRMAGAHFYVTVPRLEMITLAGSGTVTLDRAEGDEFIGTVAGPGELTVRGMKVAKAEFSVAGPGTLSAVGTAGDAQVNIAGSGDFLAQSLRSQNASISIAGSGDVALTVDQEAKVSIMGSGDVAIAGGAKCSVSKMGSGDVTCGGRPVDDD